MPSAKAQVARRSAHDAPELLIAYLRYALDDVRSLSDRSGRHLEQAIETLTEDTSVVDLAQAVIGHRS
jgi:hypothetical protein